MVQIFFRSKIFHRLGFFSNKLSHTQNLQNFHYGFFPKKKSCNRSRIFTRNGWWYSQVPNRPREKDIDDFRFLSPVPTHGHGPQPMGPNPGVPAHGSQPLGPNPGPLGSLNLVSTPTIPGHRPGEAFIRRGVTGTVPAHLSGPPT